MTTLAGELIFLETKVLNPGTSGTFYGQGPEAQFSFRSSPAPVLEEQPGSPLGCKAWALNVAESIAWRTGIDEGVVQVSTTAGTNPPIIPTCSFFPTRGYVCPDLATQSSGGTIANGPLPGTFTLTDPDVSLNANNTNGRHVLIQGASNVGNNGLFPIVAIGGASTLLGANPSFVAETLPVTAIHLVIAAAGPIPSVVEPGFVADDVAMTISLTSGGAGDFPSFSAASSGSVGDMPALAIADLNVLNNTPTDGSQFSVGCDAAGCPPGSASLSVLEIVTTDGAIAGSSPFAMPTPLNASVRVRCVVLGTSTVTVPAAFSALLQSSGATRLQSTFMRLALHGGAPAGVTVTSGHAIRGFRTP